MMDKTINPDLPNAADPPGDAPDAELLAQLAALPKSIAPQHDPWQRIAARMEHGTAGLGASVESRLKSTGVFAGKGWLALAASLMLFVTSVVLLRPDTEATPAAGQTRVAATKPGLLLNEQGARVPATSIEREYQAAFREFLALEFTQAHASLSAASEVQQDWALMQRVETELLVALEQEPQNPWLLQKLMHLRSRQLQLLHAIADSGQQPGGNPI